MTLPDLSLPDVAADRSSIEQNKALVQAFFAALNDDEPATAAGCFGVDATFWVLSHRQAVPAHAWLQGYADMVRAPARDRVRFTIVALTAEEDRVAAAVECLAPFADGRVYDNRYHFLFELADGHIAKAWEYGDTLHSQQVFRAGEGS